MLDVLVKQALSKRPDLLGLENVIEKEILHHDIMTVLHRTGVLQQLTFIGGTSLRLCYNSSRLSEDLDFTAGLNFMPEHFDSLADDLKLHLEKKYGLNVSVREPKLSKTDTSSWKITIEKHSNRPDLPSQKMHIDVCSLPSFEVEHHPIIDHYGINSSMAGLPIPVQSLSEILADKMVAFAFRERRIKPRDIWDIVWLKQQTIEQRADLVLKKLSVREKSVDSFLTNIDKHSRMVHNDQETKQDFYNEMGRFLPVDIKKRTLDEENFWPYLVNVINKEANELSKSIKKEDDKESLDFKM